jgi:tape measure domain-containing protein
MANVDDRVVSMSFETSKFQTGVSATLTALQKLDSSLATVGKGHGLDDIEKSANKVTFGGLSSAIDKLKSKFSFPGVATAFSGIESAADKVHFGGIGSALDKLKSRFQFGGQISAFGNIEKESGKVQFSGLSQALDGITSKFSALQVAAGVALGNIATQGFQRLAQQANSFTLGPVISGLQEYSTNLNSIQTILANTQASGANLQDVNSALQELNRYSDQTIYNFSQMAKNIGTFTAAGVDLKTATGSIKGIANLAALSGSNSEQASTAMYQLSQAISAGRVSLQDWNSVVNAGMGGTVFQRALAQTAQSMGTLGKGSVELKGKMKNVTIAGQSFRESITAKPGEKSWLTSDVLTKTLQQFTGDLSDADLKAQGFNESQIKAIQAQAKTAKAAATEVKTLGQVFDVAKETIGSGWAQTFQNIFGNFTEAKATFTGLSNAINGLINTNSNARNKLLKDWKDLGGRRVLIDGLKQAFHDLTAILKPIGAAFREVFPRKTGQDLFNFTVRFRDLMDRLKPSKETIQNIKNTFQGLFAVLDIGKQIVGGIFTAISKLFPAVGKGSGGILELTGHLGILIAEFNQWLHVGDKVHSLFAAIGTVLAIPINLIGKLADAFKNLFSSGGDASGVASSIHGMTDALKPSAVVIDAASQAWDNFLVSIQAVKDFLSPFIDKISSAFSTLDDAIANALKGGGFDQVFNVIQTGLIAGIFLQIKKALGGGLSIDIGGGVIGNLNKSLGILQGNLVAIQKNLQAHTLLLIATAVGVLAASVVALSLVKPDKLAASMTAITVGLGQLMGAMFLISKMSGAGGFIKFPIVAAGLIAVAAAIDILAIAIIALSKLSWEELAKGLAGVGGAMVVISIAVEPLSAAGPGMLIASTSMIALGIALNILGGAIKIFSTMKWGDMAKGILGAAAAIDILSLAARAVPPSSLLVGPGLILLGLGLTAIAGAVKVFGLMDWATIGKGLGSITAALVAIGLSMNLMPPTLPLTAAALILVGIGLTAVAGSIRLMGSMNTGTLAKGIIAIGAALVVLAGGLTLMIAALPGAIALDAAAAGLVLLVPIIGILGKMKFSTIAKGLGVMVASLVALGVAGTVAAPGLIALGAAMVVLGAGLTLTAGSVYLLAKGFILLGSDGGKGVAVVIASLTALVAILPKVIINFIKGLVQIVAEIAKIAPAVVASTVKIVQQMLEVFIRSSPKMAEAAIALIGAFLRVLNAKAGPIIQAGAKLLVNLLKGIAKNIATVTTQVAIIVTRFLGALTSKLPQLTAAGAKALAALLKGIANNLGKVTSAALNVIVKFVAAVVSGLSKLVSAGVSVIASFLKGVAKNVAKVIAAGTSIIVSFVKGVGNAASRVVTAALKTATKFISTLAGQIPKEVDRVATAIIRMMNALAAVIRQREPEFIRALGNIGRAIVSGIIDGMTGLGKQILNKIKDEIASLPGKGIKLVRKAFGVALSLLPEGLARIGGGVFTKGFQEITKQFDLSIKSLLSMGEANVRLLYDFGQELSGSLKDGLLAGIPVKEDEPLNKVMVDLVQKISDKQHEVQASILETYKQIRSADRSIANENTRLSNSYVALSKAKTISDKSDRDSAVKTAKDHIAASKQKLEQLHKERDAASDAAGKYALLYTKLQEVAAEVTVYSRPAIEAWLGDLLATRTSIEQLNVTLDEQTQKLNDLKQARQALLDQTTETFSALPGISATDENGNKIDPAVAVQNYINSLSNADDVVGVFTNSLDTLVGMGLNQDTYKQLLDAGPAVQGFVNALINAGPDAIAAINGADKDLKNAAAVLGEHAASEMYDASIKTWEGFVKGTQDSIDTAVKHAQNLVDLIIKAVKKKLNLKSPSRVFAEIGALSMEGLALGMVNSSKMVEAATQSVADDAIASLKSNLGRVSDAVASNIDMNPTITPILDLTQIKKDAQTLGTLIPSSSLLNASSISVDQTRKAEEKAIRESPIKLEQNNYSPKALSEIEIYRQTKNLVSQTKKVLATT